MAATEMVLWKVSLHNNSSELQPFILTAGHQHRKLQPIKLRPYNFPELDCYIFKEIFGQITRLALRCTLPKSLCSNFSKKKF